MSGRRVSRPPNCLKCGVELNSRVRSGYCVACFRVARPCADDGCPNWVSGYNRRGYCQEHYKVGEKLQRWQKADQREQEEMAAALKR